MPLEDPLPADLTDCAVCGLPADCVDAFTAENVQHFRRRCLAPNPHTYWEWAVIG